MTVEQILENHISMAYAAGCDEGSRDTSAGELIEELTAAGFKIVPREPTEAMRAADYNGGWEAAWDAA